MPWRLVFTVLIALCWIGPARAVACDGPVTLLVDRSASMAAHDPGGTLRLAVGAALDRVRAPRLADRVAPFGAAVEPGTLVALSWSDAVVTAMSGGDRGATDLGAALSALAGGGGADGARLVVVTDAEAELDGAPPTVLAGGLVLTLGGTPGAKLRGAARVAGAVAVHAGDTAQIARAVGGWCRVSSRFDVVLIGGLGEVTGELRGAREPGRCVRARALAVWCRGMVAAGARVWVPSGRPGGRGTLLDSTGALAPNAAALRRWLRAGTGDGAVLVGHSMGGLIAHGALAGGGAAAGLITVGTPHAGSYGADAYFAAVAAARGCVLVCPAVGVPLALAAARVRQRFGAALNELSRDRRIRDAPLGRVPVPLAVWAGDVNRRPTLRAGARDAERARGGYVWPNDGIVGVGSATGALAALSPSVIVPDGAARHSTSVPPRSAPTQLSAPEVRDWIVEVARRMARGEVQRDDRARRLAAAGGGRRPPRATATLHSLEPLAADGSPHPAAPGAVVVATTPIGLLCDGAPLTPVEVSAGLWFVDLGDLGCERLARAPGLLTSPADAALLLGGATSESQRVGERLVAMRRARGGWTVLLRTATPGSPTLMRGGRRVRLDPDGDRGSSPTLRWRARIAARGSASLAVRVAAPGEAPRVGALALP